MYIVYSKNACPQCERLKTTFKRLGIEYEEINISNDSDKRDWLLEQGHRMVPVVYDGDRALSLAEVKTLLGGK